MSCHIYANIIPHSFFSQVLYYYVMAASLVIICYFLYDVFRAKDPQGDLLFGEGTTPKDSAEEGLQKAFMEDNEPSKLYLEKHKKVPKGTKKYSDEDFESDIRDLRKLEREED